MLSLIKMNQFEVFTHISSDGGPRQVNIGANGILERQVNGTHTCRFRHRRAMVSIALRGVFVSCKPFRLRKIRRTKLLPLDDGKRYDTLCMVGMEKGQISKKQLAALRFLRNAIVHDGYSPSVRDVAHALGYKSPRTAFLLLNDLIEGGWLKRGLDGGLRLRKNLPEAEDHARTVKVPLVGKVACGTPLLAEENVEALIPVSIALARPGWKYFLLRATGDSMNKAGIDDSDLVLVRQQPVADNSDRVVALIDDEATVKEIHREKGVVVLKPRSTNKKHKPIILTENFIIQGVVISVLPANLY